MFAHFVGIYGRYPPNTTKSQNAPRCSGEGENGRCLSYSPAESVAALQEITETPRVMVHL